MSHVFRRSVDASSLRGTYDPENIIRISQDTRKTTPPPAKDGDKSRDPAPLVPLPSSPIDIPPPLPILRVDLGPPAMLSPFQLTHSDLAEIKVLQDPSNITTGAPDSCPLNWPDIHTPLRLQPGAVAASSELPEVGSQQIPVKLHRVMPSPVSVGEKDDISGRCASDLWHDSHTRSRESHVALVYEHLGHSFAPPEVDCDDPFHDVFPSSKVLRDSAAANHRKDSILGQQSLECIEATTCHVSKPSSPTARAMELQAPTDAVCRREELPDDAIEVLQLPSPVVALRISSSERTGIPEQTEPVPSKDNPNDSDEAPADTEVSRAQKKYRDSLAGLGEGLELEKLDSEVTRHVEQNPFVGAPGTPAPAFCRSETVVPTAHSSPLDENFDAIQISTRTTRSPAHFQELKENHINDLFLSEGTKHEIVHQHGPPSPERPVRLPLRPKPAKQASFESTLFKPILDRVAAKHLGVFRPGSDPSLRQKYFSHSTASTSSPVRYPRQPSLDLDLDDTESDDSESCDDLRLFERTVEQPSPLNIRKQSNTTPGHTAPSPQTPASASTPQAPGSSPIRTPSMGDRRLFDLQRAERDARYNAIHSGGSPSTMPKNSSDIQLAEFDNAGPGSKGSTPTRSSGGRRMERHVSLTYLQRLMGQDASRTPSPNSACLAFKTLSRN